MDGVSLYEIQEILWFLQGPTNLPTIYIYLWNFQRLTQLLKSNTERERDGLHKRIFLSSFLFKCVFLNAYWMQVEAPLSLLPKHYLRIHNPQLRWLKMNSGKYKMEREREKTCKILLRYVLVVRFVPLVIDHNPGYKS